MRLKRSRSLSVDVCQLKKESGVKLFVNPLSAATSRTEFVKHWKAESENGSAFCGMTFTVERRPRNKIAGRYLGYAEMIDYGKESVFQPL